MVLDTVESLNVKSPYRTSLHVEDSMIKFLPQGRSWLVVWKRRQPVEGIAVMLSAIQSWMRFVQTKYGNSDQFEL